MMDDDGNSGLGCDVDGSVVEAMTIDVISWPYELGCPFPASRKIGLVCVLPEGGKKKGKCFNIH